MAGHRKALSGAQWAGSTSGTAVLLHVHQQLQARSSWLALPLMPILQDIWIAAATVAAGPMHAPACNARLANCTPHASNTAGPAVQAVCPQHIRSSRSTVMRPAAAAWAVQGVANVTCCTMVLHNAFSWCGLLRHVPVSDFLVPLCTAQRHA